MHLKNMKKLMGDDPARWIDSQAIRRDIQIAESRRAAAHPITVKTAENIDLIVFSILVFRQHTARWFEIPMLADVALPAFLKVAQDPLGPHRIQLAAINMNIRHLLGPDETEMF